MKKEHVEEWNEKSRRLIKGSRMVWVSSVKDIKVSRREDSIGSC